MSVPDKDLDEPDYLLCEEHGEVHPCIYCKFDYQLQRGEEERERRMMREEIV